MTRTAHLLALLAVAAAIECPDETWLELNGKCYSKRARGTHAECATICGANASLVRITSRLEAIFREAIKVDPKDADAHPNLGDLLKRLGKDTDAEASYREAIKVDPKHAAAHNYLAKLLAKKVA